VYAALKQLEDDSGKLGSYAAREVPGDTFEALVVARRGHAAYGCRSSRGPGFRMHPAVREAWQMRRRAVTIPNAREPGGNVASTWTLDGLMAPNIEDLIDGVVVMREKDDYPSA
ncbi:hypothetical protein KC368_g3777, partial [Hortaea werneckii]